MGFSVSASFAILMISTLIAVSILYTSFEETYLEVSSSKEAHDSLSVMKLNSRLDIANWSYLENGSYYNVYFNLTNEGSLLRPNYWDVLYDGIINSNYISLESREYMLPGESIELNVTNIPKTTQIHSIVATTEYGCSLKIKWTWDNQTNQTKLLSESWYCPLEG
ncbi:hypothetical protein PAP_04460 [Palaeococcus pacificus DY20341]|uniref:Flagella n=1 Tax=Palaeococcus pacificus DY20341 TaxID=1343739 RepID=A0A075LXL9_9EURY|nr:hypothetical protein [Palaeococcus pacificus]AIF69303.1 hypothetical protein PAP_04460 [Palaeococcus pacificus DY20341]